MCLTFLNSDKPDDFDAKKDLKIGSGSESGSFGTFVTGLGGLLSGVEFLGFLMLTTGKEPVEPPLEGDRG